MSAYYNENDGFAAEWLRELIKANLIAPGEVDERDIQQVEPGDLRGFTQCHFFAGIGVWSYALRASDWSDHTPVWTGSCPCQSFSASGQRRGFSDERHLWPAWFRLIRECRPDTVFGEQVASKDGLAWFDIVSSEMEGEGYAIGAADTCAAGYGAPMLSQRLYFVAETRHPEFPRWEGDTERSVPATLNEPASHRGAGNLEPTPSKRCGEAGRSSRRQAKRTSDAGELGGMATPEDAERRRTGIAGHGRRRVAEAGRSGLACGLEASHYPTSARIGEHCGQMVSHQEAEGFGLSGCTNGFWRDAEWIWCRDEKYRPIEPGTFPLAYESPNRVGRLRGYGNALVAEQAKGFIESYREVVASRILLAQRAQEE